MSGNDQLAAELILHCSLAGDISTAFGSIYALMMLNKSADTQRSSLAHKAASGAIGGLLGSAMMVLLEVVFRKKLVRWEDPIPDSGLGFQAVFRPDGPVKRAAIKYLQDDRSEIPGFPTAVVLHGIFGATAGSAYAIATCRRPETQFTRAALFGVGLWVLAAQVGLPVLSLSQTPARSSIRIQAFGLGLHIVYGICVEEACRTLKSTSNDCNARDSGTTLLARQ